MPFDLGDLVPLSVTVTNAAGAPADASAVNVTVTLPDGTTTPAGPIASTTPGVYNYDYATTVAGRHHVRWVATGANASAYSDSFDVTPVDAGGFVSLADVKNHLRLSGSGDDELLRSFVATACQMITDRMGQVSPLTVVTDRHPRHRHRQVVLPTRPVISITSVQRLPGLEVIPPADAGTGTPGWTLESVEGVLSVTGWSAAVWSGAGWLSGVRVTYRAGRSPLPANFRMAALELVAHLWRGSQHNQAGGRPSLGETDAVSTYGRAYAMPFRVMELLGLKKDQERDAPLVG